MNRGHAEYEKLCVFAVVGELSCEQENDLRAHAESCLSCRRRLAEVEAASCAYFLHHAGEAKTRRLPAGLHERFEKRAANVGIPLRDTTSALFRTRLVSLAVSVLLLTFAARVGLKVHKPQEQGVDLVETTLTKHRPNLPRAPGAQLAETPSREPLEADLRSTQWARHSGSSGSLELSRRVARNGNKHLVFYQSTHQHRPNPDAIADGIPPQTPDVVKNYLTPGFRLPVRKTFELSAAPRLLADSVYPLQKEHAFRYSPSLATLMFSGASQRNESPRSPVLKESPPLFPIQNEKAW